MDNHKQALKAAINGVDPGRIELKGGSVDAIWQFHIHQAGNGRWYPTLKSHLGEEGWGYKNPLTAMKRAVEIAKEGTAGLVRCVVITGELDGLEALRDTYMPPLVCCSEQEWLDLRDE